MDIFQASGKTVTGGADRNIVVFDKAEEKIVCTLKGTNCGLVIWIFYKF